MLRYLTAGESHGPAVGCIVEGVPAGLRLERDAINGDLRRRQGGHGRGGRMAIEHDEVEVLSGLRGGVTMGTPLTLLVKNRDHDAWRVTMDPWQPAAASDARPLTRPRPGHADLAGALKLGTHDARDVLERASARSTVARVLAGAVARAFLRAFDIEVVSQVVAIGPVRTTGPSFVDLRAGEMAAVAAQAEASDVRCADVESAARMRHTIDEARREGDSLGGVFEVAAVSAPPGLGSYAEVDRRLDGRLAAALMSIQAIKGVEVGLGFEAAARRGSEVHDPIAHRAQAAWGGFERASNRAGGIEGGVSNGQPIVVRCAMKPIPTLARALGSVDLVTKEVFNAAKERTDSVAVPAAAVVGEAAVAWVVACAFCEKMGGDTMAEVARNFEGFRSALARF